MLPLGNLMLSILCVWSFPSSLNSRAAGLGPFILLQNLCQDSRLARLIAFLYYFLCCLAEFQSSCFFCTFLKLLLQILWFYPIPGTTTVPPSFDNTSWYDCSRYILTVTCPTLWQLMTAVKCASVCVFFCAVRFSSICNRKLKPYRNSGRLLCRILPSYRFAHFYGPA